MVLIYVDIELHEKLKELSKLESRPMVAVIRHRIFSADECAAVAVATGSERERESVDESPIDPEEKWEWTKEKLNVSCGCVFDDEMEVVSVTDWKLFKTINNGKLAEKYRIAHPGEKEQT